MNIDSNIYDIIFNNLLIEISDDIKNKVQKSYNFLQDFSANKVIYGINTGFGPMAQYRISDNDLSALQYNIIRSHSCGVGEPLTKIEVRAMMLCRLRTFLNGASGVSLGVIETLVSFLNNDIIPYIPQHGGVGASGDLVQLSHLGLCLIGEGYCFYKNEKLPTSQVLEQLSIKPLELKLRDGLAIANGTSCMTGLALLNLNNAKNLLELAIQSAVVLNEIANSYDDFLSGFLNAQKHHSGQIWVAQKMSQMTYDSKRMLKREETIYKENQETVFSHKLQPFYSLRCVPQILGPIKDTIDNAEKIIFEEFISTDDNPIVDCENKTVYHGGNFHGDYISFEMDKLKIAITKLTMLIERQLSYIFHDKINGILPPFVNMGVLGLNYGLQAAQFTATSTTAECQTLSNPMYVHSIPCNNENQDIVSMGTNSALIAKRVIDNSYQVMAINLIALMQAVDCLKIKDQLSSVSSELYKNIRNLGDAFVEDTPKFEQINTIINFIKIS